MRTDAGVVRFLESPVSHPTWKVLGAQGHAQICM